MKSCGLILLSAVSLVLAGGCATGRARGEAVVSGELKQWHDVMLTFAGPG